MAKAVAFPHINPLDWAFLAIADFRRINGHPSTFNVNQLQMQYLIMATTHLFKRPWEAPLQISMSDMPDKIFGVDLEMVTTIEALIGR